MSKWSDLWNENLQPLDQASSAEWNRRGQVLGTQPENALAAHGAGVVDSDDFAVAAGGGLSVVVGAGRAVVETARGFVGFATTTPHTLSGLPDNGESWVYVGAVITADPTEADSRKDNTVSYAHNTTGIAPAAHIVLAKVVTAGGAVTAVEDLRSYIRGEEALAALASLDAALAALDVRVDGLEDRVDGLEGGVGGGAATVYWGALERTAADPTRVDQHITTEIAQHVADYHDDEEAPGAPGVILQLDQWEVDAANVGQTVLAITRKLDQEHPDEFQDAVVVVHGVYGDGSGGTPDWVDHVNTTW